MLGVQWDPTFLASFVSTLQGLQGRERSLIWFLYAAQAWELWTIRNKFTIEAIFSRQPADCVFKTMLMMELWRPLLRDKEGCLANMLVEALSNIYNATRSPPAPLS